MSFDISAVSAAVALFVAFVFFAIRRNRAMRGLPEQPELVLGQRAWLSQLESGPMGFDPTQPRLPAGKIESYTVDSGYLIRFETPFEWLKRTEDSAYFTARHRGYPISLLASRKHPRVFVQGEFGSGEAFIGELQLLQ